MKNFKNILFLLLSCLFIQGCSNNSANISSEDANKIASNIKIETLKKTEFELKANKLIIELEDEFITKDDIESILEKSQVFNKIGIESFNKDNLLEKVNTVEFISSNGNKAILDTSNISNIMLEIKVNKYSESYVKNKIHNFSKTIISFNDYVGRIEIDLKNNEISSERIEKYNSTYDEINNFLKTFDTYSENNTDFKNIEILKNKMNSVKSLVDSIKLTTDNAINTKQSTLVNSQFLNVNELDKLARDFSSM